jgi:hypothetical protein
LPERLSVLGSSLFFGFPLLSVFGIGIALLELLVDPISNVAQFRAAAKGHGFAA